MLLQAIDLLGVDSIDIDDLFQPISHAGTPLMPGEIVEQTDNSVTFKGMISGISTNEL